MSNYPSEWRVTDLGAVVAEIVAGQSPNRMEHPARNGKKGILKTTAIQWSGFSPLENLEALPDFTANSNTIVRKNDILITKAGPSHRVGVVALSNEDTETLHVSGKMAAIRTSEEVDPKFLAYQMSQDAFQMQLRSDITGMALSQTNITHDNLLAKSIVVPPLPEQKKIAEILSGIDKELAICHENLSRTNLLRTSLLKRMMDDAEEESLEKSLGSVVEVINGRAYKLTEWENEGTPVIRLQNLTKQGGSFYYSNLRLPEKQYCEKGDLLFMWSASFGPHIWWGEKAIYHYHIWKMVPKCNSLLKDYLYLFLQYKTEEWKSQGAGMAMIHLTKEGIEKEVIPLPPVTSQQRVVNTIKSIDNLIEETKAKANKISLLKSAISADLLSGRKRVSV